jgi:hypothetical protein
MGHIHDRKNWPKLNWSEAWRAGRLGGAGELYTGIDEHSCKLNFMCVLRRNVQ